MTTDTRYDGYGQVLEQSIASRQYGTQLLGLAGVMGARAAYAQGGLLARVIDMPADMATARGVTITNAPPELAAEMDRLGLLDALSDALRWSLLDGGGALVVLSQDSAPLAEPLDPSRLVRIEEFVVVSIDDMKAGPTTYRDPQKSNYGKPDGYLIQFGGSNEQVFVHESRVIEVPGAPRGRDMLSTSRIPWAGRGVGPKAIQAIERYRRCLALSEKLLDRSQQAVHKMKGLASMLLAKQEDVVRARIDLVDSNRGALNGVAVDSDDDYTITAPGLSGVKDILGEAQVGVASETGLPVTVLFGRSPGGLNATGESDWATVYDMVSRLQHKRLGRAIERAVSLIFAQSSVVMDRPEVWNVHWNGLAQLTETQQAELDNKRADTQSKVLAALKVAVVDTAALSQDEATEFLRDSRLFGLEPGDEAGDDAAARSYAGQT
jgi:phage-related protein (TIGR01555 family)